jgi:high affinity Mn2+ porin
LPRRIPLRGSAGLAIMIAAMTAASASVGAPVLRAQVAPDPYPATSATWNEWYLGGQFGYTEGDAKTAVSGPRVGGSSNMFGWIDGGLHLGDQQVFHSHLLVGAEADVTFPGFLEDGRISPAALTRATSVSGKLDYVSTLRARLGYLTNRWTLYATSGLAVSQARFIESTASANDQDKIVRAGWALGAGAAFALAPGWTVRAEYRFDQLGRAAVTFPNGAAAVLKPEQSALRLGLSRSLSWPHHETRATASTPPPAAPDRWNVHAQATYIEQGDPGFHSPYQGANSLSAAKQVKNTLTMTAFSDVRLWTGADLVFDPELDQGFGLSATHGVAAFPSGEAQKASFAVPRFDVDRFVVRQTFGLGGSRDTIPEGPNQLATTLDASRLTVSAGRITVTDYFDGNVYSNDPRANFLNWSVYGAGAYDFGMDQLSWTWGAVAELLQGAWGLRAGYFLLPAVSGVNAFDMHILEQGEYALELERQYTLGAQPGAVRLFGWVNRGDMGSYAAAVALPASTPNYPDVTLTREIRTNPGGVISAEQAVTNDLGLFSRLSWSPGHIEIIGASDCSNSVSLGGVLKGRAWGRPNDNIGLSGETGGLSSDARAYFAAGGLGIVIGDGAMNYRREQVLETYYALMLEQWVTLSLDYQFIADPAYNADRGPVSVFALRIHTAF